MSDRQTFNIEIKATDGASQSFKRVSDGAKSMGQAVAEAGKQGAASFKGFVDGAAEVGRGVQFAIQVLDRFGQSAITLERQIQGLGALYGDAADEVMAFADSIQASTIYTAESAREAMLRAYDVSQALNIERDAMQDLIERGTDLARVYGYDLLEVTNKLELGLQGNARAVRDLGIVMTDAQLAAFAAANGLGDWNAALSESERANIRLQYIMHETNNVQGQAAEYAATTAGRFQQIVNDLEDMGTNFAHLITPISGIATVIAPYAMALPAMIAGTKALGAGVMALGGGAVHAASGLAAMTTRMNAARIGAIGLGTALGGALAAALAIPAAFAFSKWIEDLVTSDATTQDVTRSVSQLTNELNLMQATGADTTWAQSAIQGFFTVAQAATDNAEAVRELQNEYGRRRAQTPPSDIPALLQEERAAIDAVTASTEELNAATASMNEILRYTGPNVATVSDEFDRLLNKFAKDRDFDAFADGLDNITTTMFLQGPIASDLATANNKVAGSYWDVAAAARDANTWLRDKAAEAAAELLRQLDEAASELAGTYRDELLPSLDGVFTHIGQSLDLMVAAGRITEEQAATLRAGLDGIAMSGASTLEVLFEMADAWYGVSGGSLQAAADLESAYNALNRANDVVIGGTDRLGAAIQRTADLASKLFDDDPFDGVGPLVDLLNAGAISVETFNDAVAAGLAIYDDNARAQEALLAIQAQQLPYLAEQADLYADQVVALSQLTPEEQRRALALQDSAVQADLARINSLLYSAALGELPKDVATDIIIGTAQSDPIMADLLEQYVIIEEGADGTITVNFPDGDSLTGTIQDLTASIDALTIAIGGVPPLRPVVDAASAEDKLDQLEGEIFNLYTAAGDPVVIGVDADEARRVIAATEEDLIAVDGTGASVYITADRSGFDNVVSGIPTYLGTSYVYIDAYGPGIGWSEMAHGGVVPQAAHGYTVPTAAHGRAVWVGEAGPELAYLPAGTRVSPSPASQATMASMGGGGGVTININGGTIIGVDDLAEMMGRGLAQAMDSVRAADGVPTSSVRA